MSAGETLAAIARGERPAGLLHTCRLVTDAGETYGIEAVSAHFRAAPLTLSEAIADERGVAGSSDDTLLFADRYDDNLARLWRIGSGGPILAEQRIDVGFDPDMAQAGGDVFARAKDFPDVSATWCARVVDAAREALASGSVGAVAGRQRLFVLRMVAQDRRCAALLALAERSTFRHLGVLIDGSEARWFGGTRDAERSWTPRA